jgi:hypothetical protein
VEYEQVGLIQSLFTGLRRAVTKVHFLRYAEVQYYRCDLSLVPVHFLHDAEVHFLAGGPGRETGGGHARTWLLRADTHFLEHLYLFV